MQSAPLPPDEKRIVKKRQRLSYSIGLWLMYWWIYLAFFLQFGQYTRAQALWIHLPFIVVMVPWQIWQFRPIRKSKQGQEGVDGVVKHAKGLSLAWLFSYYFSTSVLMLALAVFQWEYFRDEGSFYKGDLAGLWPVGLWLMILYYALGFSLIGLARMAKQKFLGK
jgi:hypothetical protein